MSRGLDREDDDRIAKLDTQSRMSVSQGRAGGGGDTEDDRADRPHGDGLARPEQRTLTHEREEVRYGRNRYEWSETERVVIREVGRFRTLDEQDVERVFYPSNPKRFQADLDHLSKQGLLLRRSVSVGKQGEIRRVVVLSKRAKRLAQHHRLAPEGQALYAGFVKPAEVSHDASIYKMYGAEAAGIEAAGGRIDRVVLDFEFKKKIYGELNKKGDYGDLSYTRRQQDLAKLHELPMIDGKISLPDLRIEYETADGERAHTDLELATENYRPAHMNQKLRAGFKIYGVNSTSRGRRAEWEGRELSAEVLAL
jgi:hypothetical protein